MGAGLVLRTHPSHPESLPHPQGPAGVGGRTRRRSPAHTLAAQCFLVLLALTGCWPPWQLEQWSQTCNLRRPLWGVGSQPWLWPLLVGLLSWLNG